MEFESNYCSDKGGDFWVRNQEAIDVRGVNPPLTCNSRLHISPYWAPYCPEFNPLNALLAGFVLVGI